VIDEDPDADIGAIGLPGSRTHETPRGGRHYLFSGRGPTTVGKLGDHIDTRGQGGYILGPGSVLPNGSYNLSNGEEIAPAPIHLIERLSSAKEHKPAQTDDLDELHNISRALAWLERREPAIEGRGGNAWTYQTVAAVKDFGISRDAIVGILEAWNDRNVPPWRPDELELIVDNAYEYGQNEPGSAALEHPSIAFAGLRGAVPHQEKSAFAILRRPDLAGLQEPEWLFDGWFPGEGMGIAYGGKNSYKTFTNTALALDLAARGRRIAYLAGEGGAWGIWQRIRAWETSRGRQMPETFYPVGAVPLGMRPKEWEEVFKALEPVSPEMVVGDTFTKMMTAQNPNDFEAQSATYGAFDEMCKAMKCFGLLIGHSGKDQARGLLGSVVATMNADVVIEIEGDSEALGCDWTCHNMRNAELPRPLFWQGAKVDGSLAFTIATKPAKPAKADMKSWTAQEIEEALGEHTMTTKQIATSLLANAGIEGVSPGAISRQLEKSPDARRYQLKSGLWRLPTP